MTDKKVNWALVGLGGHREEAGRPSDLFATGQHSIRLRHTPRLESKRDIIEAFKPRTIYNDVP